MSEVGTIGLDLAKEVFQVHGAVTPAEAPLIEAIKTVQTTGSSSVGC
jgi:hypothetical protein